MRGARDEKNRAAPVPARQRDAEGTAPAGPAGLETAPGSPQLGPTPQANPSSTTRFGQPTVLTSDELERAERGVVHARNRPGPQGPDRAPVQRYVELGLIGRGASGEVRRVFDRVLNRVVAVKSVRSGLPDAATINARFIREAHIVAQLEHPAIVPVHDLDQLDNDNWFITMKEVHGRTLREAIREFHLARRASPSAPRPGQWSLQRLIDVLRTVCGAAGFAHHRGVVHRDLKPENIMIGDYGEVLVVDWGLAKVLDEGDVPDPLLTAAPTATGEPSAPDWHLTLATETRHGVVVGTPAYMPPEQAECRNDDIGPWTDVWSLGAILFSILYGTPPYRGSADDVIADVRAGPPREPEGADVPEALVDIWKRAMRMEPSERYAQGGELVRDLDAWVEGSVALEKARELLQGAQDRMPGFPRDRRPDRGATGAGATSEPVPARPRSPAREGGRLGPRGPGARAGGAGGHPVPGHRHHRPPGPCPGSGPARCPPAAGRAVPDAGRAGPAGRRRPGGPRVPHAAGRVRRRLARRVPAAGWGADPRDRATRRVGQHPALHAHGPAPGASAPPQGGAHAHPRSAAARRQLPAGDRSRAPLARALPGARGARRRVVHGAPADPADHGRAASCHRLGGRRRVPGARWLVHRRWRPAGPWAACRASVRGPTPSSWPSAPSATPSTSRSSTTWCDAASWSAPSATFPRCPTRAATGTSRSTSGTPASRAATWPAGGRCPSSRPARA